MGGRGRPSSVSRKLYRNKQVSDGALVADGIFLLARFQMEWTGFWVGNEERGAAGWRGLRLRVADLVFQDLVARTPSCHHVVGRVHPNA